MTDRDGRFAFAVMAKTPRMGRVKTRLTPPLAPAQAVALGASFIADTAAVIHAAARASAVIAPYIAYMPEGAEAELRALIDFEVGLVLADGTSVTDPGVTGIGRSLLQVTRSLLGQGYAGVCLVSADSPSLPAAILVKAAELLVKPDDRMVLGPAEDGGYYLIGLKAAHLRVFQDIVWSTETVAAETCARATSVGLDCALLPQWYDVDDRASLTRLIGALESGAEHAPRSAASLRQFGLLAP